MKFLASSLFLLLTMVICQPVFADVYRWTDDNGQVHFGERPPAGAKSESVKPPPPPALSPALGQALRSQIEQKQADYTRDRNQSKADEAKANAEAATRNKNCSQSRQAIASINKYMNKRMFDKDGNYVEEAGRQQKLAAAKKSVEHWCD